MKPTQYTPKTGTEPGFFDLFISFQFNADGSAIQRWEDSFEEASKLLFDATDGQMKLGTIEYANNFAGKNVADARLMPASFSGVSGATGSIFEVGGYIILNNRASNHPFVIVHELGHYLFCLGDEYRKGYTMENGECTNDPTGEGACIMEFKSFEAEVNGITVVNEFCCKENHGTNNAHHEEHKKSCWDVMGEKYDDLTIPAAGNRPEPMAPASGPKPIVWQPLVSDSKVMIVVDLESPNRERFVSLSRELERLLSRLNDVQVIDLTTNTDLNSKTSNDAKFAADRKKNVVDLLATVIGGFTADERSAQQALILVSDRFEFDSSSLQSVVQIFTNAHVQFHGFGIRPETFSMMHAIASMTRGTAKFATREDHEFAKTEAVAKFVAMIFNAIEHFGIVVDKTVIMRAPEEELENRVGVEVSGDTRQVTIPALVEEGAEEVVFILVPSASRTDLEYTIIQPDNTKLVVPETASQIQSFTVQNPQAGRWAIRIHRETAEDTVQIAIRVAVRNRKLSQAMLLTQDENEFEIRVAVQEAYPLINLEPATLLIHRNQGNEQSLVLDILLEPERSQQNELSGDLVARVALDPPGFYTLRIRLSNTGLAGSVRVHSPNDQFPGDWADQTYTPTFVRILENTIIVTQ